MESEGHAEKYRAVIDGGHPEDEPVGQRWGKVEPALQRRRRSHSPTAPRCLRTAGYGRTACDLRRTGRVSGWHRSKRTYKRKRNGEQGSVSSRTAAYYLGSVAKVMGPEDRRRKWVGEGSRRRWLGRERKLDEQGRGRSEQFLQRKTRTLSSEETGGLDQPDGCQEGPFINRQGVQAEESGDGLGEGKGEPGQWRYRWAKSDGF